MSKTPRVWMVTRTKERNQAGQEESVEVTNRVIRRGHLRMWYFDKGRKGVRKHSHHEDMGEACSRKADPLQCGHHWPWASIPTGVGGG